MIKKKKKKILKEGYGAGFSFTGGFHGGLGGTSRGGFGGAHNLGGPNMMYTYEIKQLNHTLEQQPTVDTNQQVSSIQIGSKISGRPVRSNATPDTKKRIRGLVHRIVQTDGGSIKYYVIFDEATQEQAKIDPLTAALVQNEPIEYYDATDNVPSRRSEKLKDHELKKKRVRESLYEDASDGGRIKNFLEDT